MHAPKSDGRLLRIRKNRYSSTTLLLPRRRCQGYGPSQCKCGFLHAGSRESSPLPQRRPARRRELPSKAGCNTGYRTLENEGEVCGVDIIIRHMSEPNGTRGRRPLPSPTGFESSPAPGAELERAFVGSGPVFSCSNLLHPGRERFPSGRRPDIVHPKGVYCQQDANPQ